MRRSKRSIEGWYMIDNTASGGQKDEWPIITCSHCQRQVCVVPMTTRDLFECPRCDHPICPTCTKLYRKTDECMNFQRQLDQREKEAFKELTRNVSVDPRIIKP